MAEVLTESFCERCGSRYTFESATKRVRLRGLKVMSRGLKTFVLDDKTSLNEAMAAARSETDRDQTASQLDAFHQTFNFCMSCRQYTCPKCWNEAAGQCLSCAPAMDERALDSPFPGVGTPVLDLPAAPLPTAPSWADIANGHDANGHDHPIEGDRDVLARLDAMTMAGQRPAPEIIEALVAEPAPETIDALVEEDEPAASALPTPGFDAAPSDDLASPGSSASVADAVAAFERAEAAIEAEIAIAEDVELAPAIEAIVAAPEPEDVMVSAPEPEPVAAAPEPEPVAAAPEPEPEPEPVAAAPEPEPVAAAAEPEPLAAAPEPEPEPVAAAPEPVSVSEPEPVAAARETDAPSVDIVEQPTWTIHPPAPTTPEPASLPAAATAAPEWPARPEWPAQGTSAGLPFLNRPVVPTGGVEALWAESDRAVTADVGASRPNIGVQPCVSCGLSLSATARFCRRCGSAQG